MTPMQAIVFEALRPAEARDPFGVAKARKELDTIYAWLDAKLGDREWAAGAAFTLADCAAAPSMFYADWTQPIPEGFARLKRYRAQLLARPTFAKIVDEARPFRHFFPLGAPDRD
jgi:glutathione S-transferase